MIVWVTASKRSGEEVILGGEAVRCCRFRDLWGCHGSRYIPPSGDGSPPIEPVRPRGQSDGVQFPLPHVPE
jgi:hypothetical protein